MTTETTLFPPDDPDFDVPPPEEPEPEPVAPSPRPAKEPDPEWGFIIYEIDNRGSIDLDLKTQKFDLSALSMWTPGEAALTGKATVDASVAGSLDALLLCGEVMAEDVNVFGEPLDEARFVGSYFD